MLTGVVVFLASMVLAADPVAVAGKGVMAYVGDTVILNGTGSNDADGTALTWQWTQTSGAPVALSGAFGFHSSCGRLRVWRRISKPWATI